MGRFVGCVGFLLFIFLSPFLSEASDADLKKELQKNLEQSKVVINNAKDKLSKGISVTDEVNQLKAAAENIKAAHLLIQEQFSAGEDSVKPLGSKAIDRHKTVSHGYQKALEEYLSLIETLSSQQTGDSIQGTIDKLKTLIEKILYKKKRPIFGSLPYSHINYPAKEPNQNLAITPAYKGGNKTVSSEDMKNTEEAPISAEIATLAQSLNWNPVSIYEYVKNNVETEWYWGCMKGAEETLRQKSGNDCDQATLLAALLRASGYPVRYVRGVIEFFPDIEKAKNLTGINDPQKIAEFLQKAGIPYKTVIAGGRISNIQIEHIWVESQIPYSNYRGAVLDEYGKTWLGLDTSIKVTGYTYNQAADGAWQIASGLRDEYLNSAQTQTPLDYLKGKLSDVGSQQNPQLTADSYKLTRILVPEVLNILPASLQFTEVKITNEYTSIPDELVHKVKFIAKDSKNSELLKSELRVLSLSNKPIAISYEPETIEDQQIINSYGGLSNTPAYLVRLRPTLKINGERIAVATDGLPMGSDFTLTIEVKSPGTSVQRITNTHVVGNLSVIGITAQKTNGLWQTANSETKSAEQILYEEAMSYTNRWNQAEDELASLFHLSITRPIPTVVTIGGVIDVTYLLDTPHGFEWKGVFVDASLKAIETAISHELSAISQNDIQKTFMQLSSLQGSILENKIFEDDFKVDSISTAKLIQLSHEQNSYELIAIDKSNITTILPTLLLDDNIKEDIQNAVNQNLVVHIPQAINHEPYAISYEDWTGIGYIKENLETGESGWMLSGMIAGGMTAWRTDKWPPDIYRALSNPYAEPPNTDSLSGQSIQKVQGTDLQVGIVGEILAQQLSVQVFDKNRKPVEKAEVVFTVKAGGGRLVDPKTKLETTAVTVETDSKGIAKVSYRLGQRTIANPTFVKLKPDDKYLNLLGENIIDAILKSKGLSVPKPFTAYGKPAEPYRMTPLYGNGKIGEILSFAGFVSLEITDKYENPIANLPVVFTAIDAIDNSGCNNPNKDTRQAKLVGIGNPCLFNAPTLGGDCSAVEKTSITEMTSSGTAAHVILGGIPGAVYKVKAECEENEEKKLSYEFKLYTKAFGNCGGDADPEVQLDISYVYVAGLSGGIINTRKVGEALPMKARINFLKEKETTKSITFTCDDGQHSCDKIVGSREYEVVTQFKSAEVTFGGNAGTPSGANDGNYEGTYKLLPGLNRIEILGKASIEAERTKVECSGCSTTNQTIEKYGTEYVIFYGVDVKLDPLPLIIVDIVDEKAYATADSNIAYTIEPIDNQAWIGNAFVFIYKDGDIIAQIPTETRGRGTATISKGFEFDIKSKYEVEAILNYGAEGAEIKSGKTAMPVVQISVLTDEGDNSEKVDEIKFGDGSNPKKRYKIELQSKAIGQTCSLTGTIKTILNNGDPVKAPDEKAYYPSQNDLTFTQTPDGCSVKINNKDNFIITNLSKADLQTRGTIAENTAALYGGIGSIVRINIREAVKDMPIEPIGVIVLGIDGLRQDVLYSSTEASYNDSQGCVTENCNVSVGTTTLPGLSQIIKDTSSIKLKDVTAIFPSITLASWASIFTGEQPDKTGIPGNEFFDRPSSRMITFSDGAFKMMSVLDRYPIFGKSAHKPGAGATDQALSSNIETIYETIKKTNPDLKTTVVFHNYSRGADKWLYLRSFIDKLKFAWNGLVGNEESIAALMDSVPVNDSIDYMEELVKNKTKFPALLSIYLAGLDHSAHDKGMSAYKNFFTKTTDPEIKKVIDKLIQQGEFDNKIFIIVADHGMTQMPTGMTYIHEEPLYDPMSGEFIEISQTQRQAEMSCSLKTNFAVNSTNDYDGKNARNAELNNNNLHIWELGNLFTIFAPTSAGIKLLAPEALNNTGINITQNPEVANVVAALNGPMAHIYIKGTNWQGNPDETKLGIVIDALIRVLALGENSSDKVKKEFNRLYGSIDKILVRKQLNGEYKVVTGVSEGGTISTESIDTLENADHIKAVLRIAGMNNKDRSGDIILIMKDSTSGNASDRYTTGVACKSWHGSLNPSDSYVPFIVAYPGGNKTEIGTILKKDTVCKEDYSECNSNWKMPDMIKEIIKNQYSEQ